MLYQFTRFFIIHRITAHNRTSRSKSADDDYGGHYRIAKTKLFQRDCFGYFLLYVVVEHPTSDVPQKEGTSLSPSERRPMLTLAATWRSWCYYTHVTDMLTGSHGVPRMAG